MKIIRVYVIAGAVVIALMVAFAGVALTQDSQGDSDAQTNEDQSQTPDAELRILEITFTFDMTATEYEETFAPFADAIANVDGLVWKVWIMNDEDKEAGGIHLFENAASINAYLNSEIVAGLASHPKLSGFSVKQFDVMESVSAVTRAPLGEDD